MVKEALNMFLDTIVMTNNQRLPPFPNDPTEKLSECDCPLPPPRVEKITLLLFYLGLLIANLATSC